MDRLFIGIDYSLQSTGVVFRHNQETRYLSILNKYALSKAKTKTVGEVFAESEVVNTINSLPNLVIKPLDILPIPVVKKIGLHDWERLHIAACLERGKAVYEAIKEEIRTHYSNCGINNTYISLENYSYGSDTNNLIQVVEATMKLKQMLFEDMMLSLDHFYIETGPTLKKWVGHGGNDKYLMLMAFIQNHRQDDSLKDDPFWQTVKKNKKVYLKDATKKGVPYFKVNTPIDDLVDAYFMCLWLEGKIGLTSL